MFTLKRFIRAIIVFAMLLGLIIAVWDDRNLIPEQKTQTLSDISASSSSVPDDTVVIWCKDKLLEEYLSDAALFFKDDTGYDVRIEIVDDIDYIEKINTASISDNYEIPAPDLYITTHDNLMKAYLSGLAVPIKDSDEKVISDNFPSTALHAISCDGKYVAYPLYYETNFFLYNKTYMAKIAENRIQSENGGETEETAGDGQDGNSAEENAAGNTGAENTEASSTENKASENADDITGEADEDPMGEEDSLASQEVLDRLATMIPSTISDVITFANNYDAPDEVEAVFKWDVTDIFYNYFFVGNYMEVGGEDGDNNAIFNLYNQQTVDCLKKYQSMNQYFVMDAINDNYDNILQDFIDGKLVFTVATTDAFAKIADAQEKGNFAFDYGVAILPDVSDILQARGLSVTDVIAINGYSHKKNAANAFAAYLSYDAANSLYSKAGKLACRREVSYDNPEINNVMTEYQKSMPLPKMIETSNFWLQLEIAFAKVWAGEDPDEVISALSEQMVGQIDEITYSIPVQESIGAGAQTYFTQ